MWGLLPFLLLDRDMKIPEEQVLRVSPPLPPNLFLIYF